MTELWELRAKRAEIITRRNDTLRKLREANAELTGIAGEILDVDIEIQRIVKEKKHVTA